MKRNVFVALSLVIVMQVSASCGGGSSAQAPPPPPPSGLSIASTSPTSAVAGNPDLTLTITGTGFDGSGIKQSRVVWTSQAIDTLLATTVANSTQLTATVPAALLKSPVNAQVRVEEYDRMEGVVDAKSNSVGFVVNKPSSGQLLITSISPTSAVAGSPDLPLTVTGSNFVVSASHKKNVVVLSAQGSGTLLWDTATVSDTQVTTTIPAALLSNPGAAQVRVEIWDVMGDAPESTSNSLSFSVNGPASIAPSSDTLGRTSLRQFVFAVAGDKADASWVVEEGAAGGTVTSSGLYTAPTNAGTFHIVATSVSDPTQTAVATVSILNSGFTQTGSMHVARAGHTATLLADGSVLILGSGDANAELFDPSSGAFSPAGTMTTPRYGAKATLLANGRVLITGGAGPGTSQLPLLSSAELYDPQSRSFAATGSMSVSRARHTATLLNDGRVLITGGIDSHGGGGAATNSAELYDPATGSFAPAAGMASQRADHTATLLDSGKVLIVGGWNGHAADSGDDPPWDPLFAELFDPASGQFEYTGTMSTTRIRHSSVLLSGGTVLVLGGVPNDQNIHAQLPDPQYAEVYDPATGTFAPVGNLAILRTGYTATLLTNGLVLLAGGAQAGVAVTWADLLDPSVGILTDTGGLITPRSGHTATRLNDGRVLVTGGYDASGNELASAELYK